VVKWGDSGIFLAKNRREKAGMTVGGKAGEFLTGFRGAIHQTKIFTTNV